MPDSDRSSRGLRGLAALVLVGLCALAQINALAGEYVYDDVVYIVDNPQVQEGGMADAFLRPLSDRPELGLYRPLAVLTYQWQARGRGAEAPTWPFHLLNVLLHAGTTCLLAVLARRLGLDRASSFLAGAVFAVHPIHVEAVTWIVGRAELLAALFSLAACVVWFSGEDRKHRWGAAALWFLACLGKEGALALPAVLFVGEWIVRRRELRRAALSCLPLLVPLAATVTLRMIALEGQFAPATDLAPFSPETTSTLERMGVASSLYGKSVQTLLWPYPSRIFHHASEFRGFPWRSGIWIAALLATWWFARRDRRVWFLWAAFALSYLPTSNVRPIQETFAERFLYLPSAFACGILGMILSIPVRRELAMRRRLGRSLLIPGAVLLLGLAAGWSSNRRFDDPLELWLQTVEQIPQFPFPHYQVAYFSQLEGIFTPRDSRVRGALHHYRKALEIDADFRRRGLGSLPPDQRTRAHLNLGVILLRELPPGQRRPLAAAESLRTAEKIARETSPLDWEWARALSELAELRHDPRCGVSAETALLYLEQALTLPVDDLLRSVLERQRDRVRAELADPTREDGQPADQG